MKHYAKLLGIYLFLFLHTYFLSNAQNEKFWLADAPSLNLDMNLPPVSKPKIMYLNDPSSGSGIQLSQSFVGAIGGVYFDKIAKPANGMVVNSVNLTYDANNVDGKRLEFSINNQPVNIALADWLLIPIIEYTNSNHYSCFTYFGELNDKNLENTILNNGGHLLNYHSAFYHKLIGYRIAYMDLLLLYNFTTDLPKSNGEYILGTGEVVPNVNNNIIAQNNFITYLNQIELNLNQTFRSYVISDYEQNIDFEVDNNNLVISGNPYYCCWRYNFDKPGYDENHVTDSTVNVYNQLVVGLSAEAERKLYIDSILSAAIHYENGYNIYSSGTFVELINISPEGNSRRDFLDNYTTISLKQMLIGVLTDMFSYKVEYLQAYSQQMSNPGMLSAINPAVWNATVSTMRYAAFFRYIKENFNSEWTKLVSQVSGIETIPKVKTPTVLDPNNNSIITNAMTNYYAANQQTVSTIGDITISSCAPDLTLQTSSSGLELKFEWLPNDGSLNNTKLKDPVIVNPNTGTTTYTINVTDINGNTASDNVNITVAAKPTVSTIQNTTIDASNQSFVLTTAATGEGLTFEWLPDDKSLNDISLKNPTIVNPHIGEKTLYKVKVTDKYGCIATAETEITVRPKVNTIADTKIASCNNTLQLLSSLTGNSQSIVWTPNDGSLDNNRILSPRLINPNAGVTTTYTITVTDVNGNTASDEVKITIAAKPTASTIQNTTIDASNQSFVLTTAATGEGLTFEWLPDDKSLNDISLKNPTIVNPHIGEKTLYKVEVTDSYGCIASAETEITVRSKVNTIADIKIASCNNTLQLLSDLTGHSQSIVWTPDDGSLDNNRILSPKLINPNTGVTTTYTITVTDVNGNIASDEVKITVAVKPTVSTIKDTTIESSNKSLVLTTNSTGEGITFNWLPDDHSLNNISLPNPTLVDPNIGETTNYKVTVSDIYGCKAFADVKVEVKNSTGIHNQDPMEKIRIWYGADEKIFIEHKGTVKEVLVFDIAGKLIEKATVISELSYLSLNGHPAGVYIVQCILINKQSVFNKVIKGN